MTTTKRLLDEVDKLLWETVICIGDVADDLLETALHLMGDLETANSVVAVKQIADVYTGIKPKYKS